MHKSHTFPFNVSKKKSMKTTKLFGEFLICKGIISSWPEFAGFGDLVEDGICDRIQYILSYGVLKVCSVVIQVLNGHIFGMA